MEPEKCCYVDREGTGLPCDSNAGYMIISLDEAEADLRSTYSCEAHFGGMRADGDPAFDLGTGMEIS